MACPIHACRIDPKDPKRNQQWLTAAEWVILETPNGDVQVCWDEVNEVVRIIGRDQQAMRLVGNVIDISVIRDE